jgi:hypothetical protein
MKRMPGFTAATSLRDKSEDYRSRLPTRWPTKQVRSVHMALGTETGESQLETGVGETPGVPYEAKDCTACNQQGWRTCSWDTKVSGHVTKKGTPFQEGCQFCTCGPQLLGGQWPFPFQQRCTTKGVTTPGGSCTVCRSNTISLDWPAPDICLKACMGSLSIASLSITRC